MPFTTQHCFRSTIHLNSARHGRQTTRIATSGNAAGPGLEKSVPTFIDKPFVYTVADVKKMLQLSRRHGAPAMSLSILRSLPQATWVREGIADDLLLPVVGLPMTRRLPSCR